jgi:hypothetical protein
MIGCPRERFASTKSGLAPGRIAKESLLQICGETPTIDLLTKGARVQTFGQRCGDGLLVTDCHIVAGPGATASVTRSRARRAVAGEKLTKFVNAAGDDCGARDARALRYPVRLRRGWVLSSSWHLYCLENRAMWEAEGSPSAGVDGLSQEAGRADPDEVVHLPDQGHARADCPAAP